MLRRARLLRTLAGVTLGLSGLLVLSAGVALADDGAPGAPPTVVPSQAPDPAPPASPDPSDDHDGDDRPSQSPNPTPSSSPRPSPSPSATPSPTPKPTPTPAPKPSAPATLDLYRSAGFRYQDPNYVACTATSAQDMLNFIAIADRGGSGFQWGRNVSGGTRDSLLRWARSHDTIVATARGSDPHGWRNALNRFGWGEKSLEDGERVYEDRGYDSFNSAWRTAVRQMALTRKPVGMLGWSGRHAQMIVGYYGLTGDPFARDATGDYRNTFTIAGVYFSDPLRAAGMQHVKVSLRSLQDGSKSVRLARYGETDSPYDDPYTPGTRAARSEWYGHYVLLIPVR